MDKLGVDLRQQLNLRSYMSLGITYANGPRPSLSLLWQLQAIQDWLGQRILDAALRINSMF